MNTTTLCHCCGADASTSVHHDLAPFRPYCDRCSRCDNYDNPEDRCDNCHSVWYEANELVLELLGEDPVFASAVASLLS